MKKTKEQGFWDEVWEHIRPIMVILLSDLIIILVALSIVIIIGGLIIFTNPNPNPYDTLINYIKILSCIAICVIFTFHIIFLVHREIRKKW